jgi:hypothetical protein
VLARSISRLRSSSDGLTADTGTSPDSAPHIPLKIPGSSPVATIVSNAAIGVPTMSTPRTSSSGRPSAQMRYTSSGITLNACGPERSVIV